jgi:anaerobic magnesium-protoporphyrin IX monomethyl ester cyclase
MMRMLDLGFREIHMKDDNFTADIARAKAICSLLIDKGFDAPWALPTGVNVHDVDEEFFAVARKAGCYHVAFGIESGDEQILRGVNKPQSLDKMRRAVEMADTAGTETLGNFMLGLPGETEETMQRTVDFALSLPLTYAKASMTLPFPASVLYEQVRKAGRQGGFSRRTGIATTSTTPVEYGSTKSSTGKRQGATTTNSAGSSISGRHTYGSASGATSG